MPSSPAQPRGLGLGVPTPEPYSGVSLGRFKLQGGAETQPPARSTPTPGTVEEGGARGQRLSTAPRAPPPPRAAPARAPTPRRRRPDLPTASASTASATRRARPRQAPRAPRPVGRPDRDSRRRGRRLPPDRSEACAAKGAARTRWTWGRWSGCCGRGWGSGAARRATGTAPTTERTISRWCTRSGRGGGAALTAAAATASPAAAVSRTAARARRRKTDTRT